MAYSVLVLFVKQLCCNLIYRNHHRPLEPSSRGFAAIILLLSGISSTGHCEQRGREQVCEHTKRGSGQGMREVKDDRDEKSEEEKPFNI